MPEKPTYEELEQRIDALETEIIEHWTSPGIDLAESSGTDLGPSISYKTLIDSLPGIVMLVKSNYGIVISNQAGQRAGAIPGNYCFEMWGQRDDACPWCQATKALSENEPQYSEIEVAERLWQVAWMPLEKDLFLHLAFDITEKRHREDLQKHGEKLMALGTVTRGISNDFNNIMTGIKGHISLMLKDVESSHPFKEHLKALVEYITHAEYLTQQLLEFASTGHYHFKPIDLNETVKESITAFERSQGTQIVHFQYEEDLWKIEADGEVIERALRHICEYAQQTMPGGGELFLQTKNVVLDEADVKAYGVSPGEYVCVSVSDSGIGVNDAVRKKIFDPFFITEEIGWKLGLGLSSADGIVKSHGGFIGVISIIMEGTTYNLYLPVIRDRQELKTNVAFQEGTILLIDDQNVIVEVGDQMIRDLGYRCLTAKNGQDAISMYKKQQSRIDLVILDMIMPEMQGKAIFDHLKRINAGVKVLLTSGYGMTDEVKELLSRGGNGYIQKPFDITELSDQIEAILHG